MAGFANAFAASPGASALGLGDMLGSQASAETEEERRRRLQQQQQARLLGSAMPGASSLGLGTAAGGGIGVGV